MIWRDGWRFGRQLIRTWQEWSQSGMSMVCSTCLFFCSMLHLSVPLLYPEVMSIDFISLMSYSYPKECEGGISLVFVVSLIFVYFSVVVDAVLRRWFALFFCMWSSSQNDDAVISRRNSICIRRLLRDWSIQKLDQLFSSTGHVKKWWLSY